MPVDREALRVPAAFQSVDPARLHRLDSVTLGVFDCPHSTPQLTAAGPLVVRTQDILTGVFRVEEAGRVNDETYRERVARAEPSYGDLLYSREGTYFGIAAEVPSDTRVCLGQRMVLIRPDSSKVDHRYLRYWLNSPQIAAHVQGFRDGSVAERLNLPTIRSLPVFIPPLVQQRGIARVLGALDDKIEQNRRTAKALERLSQATFQAWFVDFDPVKAKAAGASAFPSMPRSVFATLPTRFVDSGIGPVPEGWAVGGMQEFATLSKAQVKPQESVEVVFDHFSIPAFDSGMRPVVESGRNIKSNKFLVLEGCVLLSKLNPRIPRVWLTPPPRGRQQIASTEFLVFLPKNAFDRHYVYCQFQQTDFREDLSQGASGTSNSHQRVRPDDVLNKAAIVPPCSVRKAFSDIVDPLFMLAASNQVESAALAEVRDYLLPKLLSGSVRVEAAHG